MTRTTLTLALTGVAMTALVCGQELLSSQALTAAVVSLFTAERIERPSPMFSKGRGRSR